GELSMEVKRAYPIMNEPITLRQIKWWAYPHKGLSEYVNDWRSDNVKRMSFLAGVKDAFVARKAGKWFGLAHVEGTLFGKVIRAGGEEFDLGLMGLNIVTTCGVQYIADAFRGTVEPEIMKYHGLGTGATAEVV